MEYTACKFQKKGYVNSKGEYIDYSDSRYKRKHKSKSGHSEDVDTRKKMLKEKIKRQLSKT